MKKIAVLILSLNAIQFSYAQNVGIGTMTPQTYGHGGTNRVLELKNDAGTGADFQSHLILSTNGTSGSLGTLTWAAPNISGSEKRTALVANLFETANATRLAFFTRTEAGSITEKITINGKGDVGIGTTTPGFPLNFSNALGDKISLYGNSGNHYGIGVQSGLLQIHSDVAASNIVFGHGSSNNFTERMKILNNGIYDGMSLNGRLLLKNGSTDLVGGGAGVWLYKADNSGQLGFMGTQNNQNIGFYGGSGGWGFTYNAINSRVGIGNNNPNAPLAFAAALGKKITLYPGTTGDAGFGVAGNRLQIFSDNPNADVAIGYDVAGVFNERFAVKPTGALAINGNIGGSGQVLQSNGSGAAATWVGKPRVVSFGQTGDVLLSGADLSAAIPGLTNQAFSLTENATIVFSADLNAYSSNIYNAYCFTEVQILNAGAQVMASARSHEYLPSFRKVNMYAIGTVSLPPGIYTINAVLGRLDTASGVARSEPAGSVIIQIFPN